MLPLALTAPSIPALLEQGFLLSKLLHPSPRVNALSQPQPSQSIKNSGETDFDQNYHLNQRNSLLQNHKEREREQNRISGVTITYIIVFQVEEKEC